MSLEAPLKTTRLYAHHKALGARLMPFAGYDMPLQYGNMGQEHEAVRQNVGLFDVSHMAQMRIRGKDAIKAANFLLSNDLLKLKNGRAQYNMLCRENGSVIDDIIAYRLADDDIFLCGNAVNRDRVRTHIEKHIQGDVRFADESEHWSQIAVQGPKAMALLKDVLGEGTQLKPFSIRTLPPGTLHKAPLYFATTGYTGEAGGEIYCQNDDLVPLWEALMEKGQPYGVQAIGLGARDSLRLEMGYCLYGHELDDERSPLEAGLSWTTKLQKNFLGRDALLAQKEKGLPYQLVGLELLEKAIARQGYEVQVAGETIGSITSGSLLPGSKKSVALAYVKPEFSALGYQVQVICRNKEKQAQVVSLPFKEPAS